MSRSVFAYIHGICLDTVKKVPWWIPRRSHIAPTEEDRADIYTFFVGHELSLPSWYLSVNLFLRYPDWCHERIQKRPLPLQTQPGIHLLFSEEMVWSSPLTDVSQEVGKPHSVIPSDFWISDMFYNSYDKSWCNIQIRKPIRQHERLAVRIICDQSCYTRFHRC